jgi:hypothetical protein
MSVVSLFSFQAPSRARERAPQHDVAPDGVATLAACIKLSERTLDNNCGWVPNRTAQIGNLSP